VADLVEGLGDLATPHPLILSKKKIAEGRKAGKAGKPPPPPPLPLLKVCIRH